MTLYRDIEASISFTINTLDFKKAIKNYVSEIINENFCTQTLKGAHEAADWLASISMGQAKDYCFGGLTNDF